MELLATLQHAWYRQREWRMSEQPACGIWKEQIKKWRRGRDGEWKAGLSRVICREESSEPILLRAVDPKRLIGNQNSYQLFNRYRANQLQRRRHGRRGDLRGEGAGVEEIYILHGNKTQRIWFLFIYIYVFFFSSLPVCSGTHSAVHADWWCSCHFLTNASAAMYKYGTWSC